jgi:hypothetical protein
MTPRSEDAKSRVNKLVAHLTYKRTVWDKDWEWAAIRYEPRDVISCFFDHLPPAREAWFADAGLEAPSGPTGTSSLPVTRGWTGPPEPPGPEKATTRE